MKQIKFRAWDKVKEKWYKNVLPLSDGMFLIENINGYKEVVEIPSFLNDRSPNEFIIVQFTGMKDKNGKEIYEGDICRKEYRNKKSIFAVSWIDMTYHSPFNAPDYAYEVIGNVYENPELLVRD